MLEVIEAIDGPICLNVCLVSGRSCHRKAHCPAHPVWAQAQLAMLEVLSGAKVADLASEAQPAAPRDSSSALRSIAPPAKSAGR